MNYRTIVSVPAFLLCFLNVFRHPSDAFTTTNGILHPQKRHPCSLFSHKNALTNALQILEFQEPRTNVTVVLVGAMHYNPSSISLAKFTIQDLAFMDKLGSVIVESCDIRWNKTLDLYERRPWLKRLLKNEMLTSCELAQGYNRPVILGDQRINITSAALKATLQETFVDLTSPLDGGWKRFASVVSKAWEETVPFGGEGYLTAFAFFDPLLLLALPVSLFKYPLSFLVRDPVPTSVILLGVLALNYYDATSDSSSAAVTVDAVWNNQVPTWDWLVSLGLAALETVVFSRLLLKPLLAERNEILAKSILDQCRLLKGTDVKEATGWFEMLQQSLVGERERTTIGLSGEEIVYAPGSPTTMGVGSDNDQAVVAILGMAHCNGIKKLLQEKSV